MSWQWFIRLYPRWFRARYGGEVQALLETSDRPVRDGLDVAAHALMARSEEVPVRRAGGVLVVACWAVFGYCLNDLAGGIVEVPEHWWSSLAAVATVVTTLAWLPTLRRRASS